ncbi:Wzz/FepE/Etk N-terminal domain-containing protein [Streptacidiphilus sp. EB129]|uniref:Wzz/FepE/Etk N-terminal domain-containing protein n=1 Tax=Streptacidiphilus sp. EB129 TaxID=3156262 RepID=UPI0035185A69
MDLAEIFRVMRRRWYVLLPGLLVTVALTVGVFLVVPPKYQSQSTVELLNSQKATIAFDGNPFLSTQVALTGMADSLARNLNSDAAIADLKSQGLTGTYVAKIADNAQGPMLWLTVTGTDKAGVLSSDQILTDYAKTRLEQFQAQQSVAPNAMIRMTTIVPPQEPAAQTKTRIEYLALAGVMGIVLSLVAVFYVEARLRGPRSGDDQDAPDGAAHPAEQDGRAEQDVARPRPAATPEPHQEAGRQPRNSRPQPRSSQQEAQEPAEPDIEQPTVQLAVPPIPAGAESGRANWFA